MLDNGWTNYNNKKTLKEKLTNKHVPKKILALFISLEFKTNNFAFRGIKSGEKKEYYVNVVDKVTDLPAQKY